MAQQGGKVDPGGIAPDQERKQLRRAMELDCAVATDLWDEPVLLRSRDFSPSGVWLETDLPLEPGDKVWVCLSLPNGSEFQTEGVVRRVAFRESASGASGMAIAFSTLSDRRMNRLSNVCVGLPPPLPQRGQSSGRHDQLVEMKIRVTYEERFGDNINRYEVEESIAMVMDDEPAFTALGALLTSDTPRRQRNLHLLLTA